MEAHDQLRMLAKLESQGRSAAASRSRKSHAKPQSSIKDLAQHTAKGESSSRDRLSRSERYKIHTSKMIELGLPQDSTIPMFAHKLSVEEIKKYPEINHWHAHRQALEREEVSHEQLPPQFQSMRGKLEVYNISKKKRTRIERDNPTDRQKKARSDRDNRLAKMNELQLPRDSLMPTFAQRLSLEGIKHHYFIDDWHRHREWIEQGKMKPEELPLHLSNSAGGITFKIQKERKQSILHSPVAQEEEGKKRKTERELKAKALGLRGNSAVPIFAHKLTAEEIKRYKDIDVWHQHRSQMENGQRTVDELPSHFQTHRGNYRFRTAAANEAYARKANLKLEGGKSELVLDNGGESSSIGMFGSLLWKQSSC
jgi:hypothetical protein